MNLLGNIIWLIFGGIFIAIEYLIASLVLFVSIIGIPFGIQTLKMAGLALFPFGRDTRVRENSSGCLYTLFNILWLFTGGLLICLSHIFWGIILAITIIGIPFARQHFKLASLALTPFGRDIYYK
ncbi:MAG: YccF domain-containing protein [Bacteroidetes bacterium HGW-Bacteroidetes-15]|nr:MAG: YccF domain-containing protein [Bacteroidetes bacterium HGW-Bacteroidetes-15]